MYVSFFGCRFCKPEHDVRWVSRVLRDTYMHGKTLLLQSAVILEPTGPIHHTLRRVPHMHSRAAARNGKGLFYIGRRRGRLLLLALAPALPLYRITRDLSHLRSAILAARWASYFAFSAMW